jgi:hypothetical protein
MISYICDYKHIISIIYFIQSIENVVNKMLKGMTHFYLSLEIEN